MSGAGFAERRRAYLESIAGQSFRRGERRGDVLDLIPIEPFYLIPRLELEEGPIDETLLTAALDWVSARRDCADFALAALLRILRRYPEPPLLTREQASAIQDAALRFCYWYDQPGIRGMCFHTENHQIIFHACELIAGQLFPDRIFMNSGQTGRWHVEQATHRTLQWMEQRARFGFAEWLSYYFEEDLLGLVTLYDFADDADIRRRAGMLIDMLLFEMALHSHQGVMGGTHGRIYAEFLRDGRLDPTAAIAWLMFGTGGCAGVATMAMTALTTSEYRCPPLVEAIAHDRPDELLCFERHGLNVEDAPRYGINYNCLEDAMFFWACQTARHPLARGTAFAVAEIADDPWLTRFIETVDAPLEICRALQREAGDICDGDVVNTALSEANLTTYRTPEYLLSCAQSFRPGKPGYQQHIWQASLTPEAVIFTTHPGAETEEAEHTSRPNFWAGNRWMPRAAQFKNVLFCIHHIPADDPLPFSHAYFPRRHFDEVVQEGNWTLARKGDGYLALYSQNPARWIAGRDGEPGELRTDTRDNIWICEMGTRGQYGDFSSFVRAVAPAEVQCAGLNVQYASPSQGEMAFGWTGPLTVSGTELPLDEYPRFDNPYCQADLGDLVYTVRHGDDSLTWDFR
jgi:hypothetical protein